MKPEHSTNALARGPPRVDPVGRQRKCRDNRGRPNVARPPIIRGAPASESSSTRPGRGHRGPSRGDPSGRPVFVSADRAHL